jgi:L-iditol 2-dehydrogenase
MKALVHTKSNTLEYIDVPMPARRALTDVIIKMRAVGICGSDVHGLTGQTGRRIPPIIMGHEVSGEIFEVGENSSFKTGERVVTDSTIFCGKCGACGREAVNLCDNRKVLGVSCDSYKQDGAMAEYFVVPERVIYRLPDSVDFVQAALIEPASVSFHAVTRTQISPEDRVLVVGAGVIGLFVVQALRIKGCKKIMIVDTDCNRANIALRYGASLYDGKSVDASFEAVGITETVNLAINATKKDGRIVLIGNVYPNVSIPLQNIVTYQKTIIGSCASAGRYPEVIDNFSAGRLDTKHLITKVAPLSEGEKWFKELLKKSGSHVKIVLTNE